MRTKHLLIILLAISTFFTSCKNTDSSLKINYFNQSPPSFVPKLFGAHLATDNDNRHSALAFSPQGNELFYSVYENNSHPQKIYTSKFTNGKWSEPTIASFSGIYKDGAPFFTPDGKRVYFYSKRPLPNDTIDNENYDIWYVEKSATGWGEPKHESDFINTENSENIYAIAKNSDLYFERDTEDRKHFLWKSKFENGQYQKPELIKELSDKKSFAEPVNIEGEDYFIYTDHVKKGRFYYAKLHISFRKEDGSWTKPKNMGDMINYGEGRFPSLSPDGKYFFFVSYRTGISQFYWVDASIIDYLRKEKLDLINQLKTSMIDNGLSATKTVYKALTEKHKDYYQFDEILFNEVANELIMENHFAKAIEAYNFNFKLYPQLKFYPQKLVVSVLENNNDKFEQISSNILNEPDTVHQDLLDKLNIAGETFLLKNNTDAAIKLFNLNAEINPQSTWPFYKLGKAYYQKNVKDSAVAYFTKAIALDSTNIYAKNYLKELNTNNKN